MKLTSSEEAYQLYLFKEHNKKIVTKFYKYLNNEEWEKIIDLFHKDYFDPIPEFIDPELQNMKNFDRRFAETFYAENHAKLTELGESQNMKYVWPPTNRKELVDIMKLEAQFEKAHSKIFNICAEDNIVFVTRSYKSIEAMSQIPINRIVHDRFLIKEGKIRQTESYHSYLGTLMQLGKVISQENDQEKVQNYLENLKKLGILSA